MRLTNEYWEDMRSHAAELAPQEACGLIAGRSDLVMKVYPLTNAIHSPFRFRLDPREQLQAFFDIEARGWQLLAIYHSHPNGPATPSPIDIREAYYPQSLHPDLVPEPGELGLPGLPYSGRYCPRGAPVQDRLKSDQIKIRTGKIRPDRYGNIRRLGRCASIHQPQKMNNEYQGAKCIHASHFSSLDDPSFLCYWFNANRTTDRKTKER